ncbi:MAG: ferredoxin, partial [Methylocystis sp.]
MNNIENIVARRPAESSQQSLPTLHVEDRDGVVHELEAVEGWRLMEILRDHGVGMDNTCGGALACAECHVVLDAESARRVPPPREEEVEK